MRSFTVQSATLIAIGTMAGCTLLVPGSNRTRDYDGGTDTGVALDAPSDARGDAFAVDAPMPDAPMPDAPMPDAFVAEDAGTDAPVIDAYTPFDVPMPDAFVEPPDAYVVVPDAYVVPDSPDACVPMVGYVDLDHDGYTVAATGCQVLVEAGLGADCDDTNAAVHPGAADTTCDGVDNDCDGRETLWGACSGGVQPRPVEVVAGAYHSCVRTEPTGEVWCWGSNNSLQCGSDTLPRVLRPTLQTRVPSPGAVGMCAAGSYTCMARGERGLDCFGVMVDRRAPFLHWDSPSGEEIVQVACSDSHACYRTASGRVDCLGLNGTIGGPPFPTFYYSGQVGRPASDGTGFFEPRMVIASGASDVAVGANYSCARLDTGFVQCWGANDAGALGRGVAGTPTTDYLPANVIGSGYLDVAVGQYATCARTATGVSCWGFGEQAVIAGQPWTPVPVRPAMLTYATPVGFVGTFTALTEGFGPRIVALNGTRAVSWGLDVSGVAALDPRSTFSTNSTPRRMYPLEGPPLTEIQVRTLAHSFASNGTFGVNNGHACAIENNAARTLWCWGGNSQSQCGSTLPSPILNAVEVTP